jgi:organic hydroperoxide reductase OsmC/OhrA
VHEYRVVGRWAGSTGVGYDDYNRAHEVEIGGTGLRLAMSGDPAFKGDPELSNPEQLLLAAAVSCQLLSFLAVAARARIDVTAYEDEAEAFMPDDDKPVRITRIELHPQITIAASSGHFQISRLEHLVQIAHGECFIANSLRSEIEVRPSFSFVAPERI